MVLKNSEIRRKDLRIIHVRAPMEKIRLLPT